MKGVPIFNDGIWTELMCTGVVKDIASCWSTQTSEQITQRLKYAKQAKAEADRTGITDESARYEYMSQRIDELMGDI